MLEAIHNCPICDSTDFRHHLQAKDHTATNEIFQIDQCTRCGLTFTNPRPAKDAIGKYYHSTKYISHTGGGQGLFDKIYLLARNITLRWKLNVIERYQKSGTILDFGCGTGEFLRYCQTRDWAITGVEPSPAARTKASALIDKPVAQNLADIPNQTFDVITLWHVLEHVHDLQITIAQITDCLKADGTLFFAVPNYLSPDSVYYRQHWAAYDVPRHLWHFSKDTMPRLLSKSGLEIADIQPMKLDAYYVSLLSEQYLNPNQPQWRNALNAFYRGFTSNLAAHKNTNNSSLIYIAKRV